MENNNKNSYLPYAIPIDYKRPSSYKLVGGPFNTLFNTLCQPQLVLYPHWFKNLKLTSRNFAIYLTQDGEDSLINLMCDIHHASFLQFCVLIVHLRMIEFGGFIESNTSNPCALLFSRDFIENTIKRVARFLEYRSIAERLENNSIISPIDRYKMGASKLNDKIIVLINLTAYEWHHRDNQDLEAYHTLLENLGQNLLPPYLFHSPFPSPMALDLIRSHQEEIAELTDLWFNTSVNFLFCNCKNHPYHCVENKRYQNAPFERLTTFVFNQMPCANNQYRLRQLCFKCRVNRTTNSLDTELNVNANTNSEPSITLMQDSPTLNQLETLVSTETTSNVNTIHLATTENDFITIQLNNQVRIREDYLSITSLRIPTLRNMPSTIYPPPNQPPPDYVTPVSYPSIYLPLQVLPIISTNNNLPTSLSDNQLQIPTTH
jgi:hypothetical protein